MSYLVLIPLLVGLVVVWVFLALYNAPPEPEAYQPPASVLQYPLTITPVPGQRGMFTITNVSVEDLEVIYAGVNSMSKATNVYARLGRSNDTVMAYRYIADQRIRPEVERALFHNDYDQQPEP